MKEPWSRGERLAALAILLAFLSVIAGFLVVPEIRRMLRLEREAKNEQARAAANKTPEDAPGSVATSSPAPTPVLPTPKNRLDAVDAKPSVERNRPESSTKVSAKTSGTHGNVIERVPALDSDGRKWLVRLHIDKSPRSQGDSVDTVIRVYNDTTQPVMFAPFCDIESEGPFPNVDEYWIESTKGKQFISYTYGNIGAGGKYRGCMKAELAPGESFAFEFNFDEVENLGRPLKLVHHRTTSDMAQMMAEMAKQPMKTLILLDFSVPIVVPDDYH